MPYQLLWSELSTCLTQQCSLSAMYEIIRSDDVEELSTIVAPWAFDMQQISRGHFFAQFNVLSINGILLTRERWSNRVLCLGTSPPGYFALVGIVDQVPFLWNGVEVNSTNLACGLDAPEIEALTGDGAEHWVVLIPLDKLRTFMGDESYDAIPREHQTINCTPVQSQELGVLIINALAESNAPNHFLNDIPASHALENALLTRVVEVLTKTDSYKDCQTLRKRYTCFRRAIRNTVGGNIPANISEMALATGTSVRVLQLAFQENLGFSPHRFLRILQLNQLNHALHQTKFADDTVTNLMEMEGFSQLGRTSVEYKQMFGDSPSKVLARDFKSTPMQLNDALLN
jgi:AraC-like DNA-binding protein